MRTIIADAADYYRVSEQDILGTRRNRPIVKARAAIAIVMRHRDMLSYPQIGARLGGRDHSTTIHCIENGWRWMLDDPMFSPFVDAHLCTPRFNLAAVDVESPYPAPFVQPPERARDRHLGPCPVELITIKVEEPEDQFEHHCIAGHKFRLNQDGLSPDEIDWRRNIVTASQGLLAAMVREHPERFAA